MLFCVVYCNRTFCFAYWTGSGMFAFGCWAGIEMFLNEKGACQNDIKTVSLQFYGFAKRYRNVCVWFMARNCRFPKVGSHGCQRGNHRLPLQGTAGSQRLELLVPNLGTMGYHCKQLPVTRGWNSCFPTWEP